VLPSEPCFQPFSSGYFEDRVLLFAQTSLDQILLFYTFYHDWMTGTATTKPRSGLLNFFDWAGLEL
jgi:hypothetical protein